MRNLPAFEDSGVAADLNPENASAGRIQNEKVTIVGAKFFIQDWKRKDGTFPETAVPEVQLRVLVAREGDDENTRPYTIDYKYGSVSVFAPSKDGRFANVRKAVMKEGSTPPVPRKDASAVRFLKSIKDANGSNIIAAMKTEGADALKGLRIQIRSQKTSDMHVNAKEIYLVDHIDGVTSTEANPKPASSPAVAANTQTQAAPVQETASAQTNNEVEALAELALIDILDQADKNTISRAQIPTTLIRLEQWKSHEQRGVILKTLRDDGFILRAGQPWKVDGNTVSKQ